MKCVRLNETPPGLLSNPMTKSLSLEFCRTSGSSSRRREPWQETKKLRRLTSRRPRRAAACRPMVRSLLARLEPPRTSRRLCPRCREAPRSVKCAAGALCLGLYSGVDAMIMSVSMGDAFPALGSYPQKSCCPSVGNWFILVIDRVLIRLAGGNDVFVSFHDAEAPLDFVLAPARRKSTGRGISAHQWGFSLAGKQARYGIQHRCLHNMSFLLC